MLPEAFQYTANEVNKIKRKVKSNEVSLKEAYKKLRDLGLTGLRATNKLDSWVLRRGETNEFGRTDKISSK